MKPNYEKFKPQRNKLAKWQWGVVIAALSLLVIATVIFIVLFYNNIFTENVLVWGLVALFVAFIVGGTIFYLKAVKKE